MLAMRPALVQRAAGLKRLREVRGEGAKPNQKGRSDWANEHLVALLRIEEVVTEHWHGLVGL